MKPGVALLWLHVALYGVIALTGYFAADVLFGPSVLPQPPAFAAHVLSASLATLAVLLGFCARDASPRLVRVGLAGALLFDVQVPVLMGRYPAMFEFMEAERGVRWFVIPLLLVLLVAVTAYQLSRAWRNAATG